MTRTEYMDQLKKYLKRLPKQEFDDAIEYFNEYFSETDEAGEQALMKELGTPKEAARELLSNLLSKKVEDQQAQKNQKKSSIFWIACLAILAAPIGAPLLAALVLLIICAVMVVGCLMLSLFLLDFSMVIISLKILLRGLMSLPFSLPGALMLTGTGIVGIGCTILLGIFTVFACRWCERVYVKMAQWIISKRVSAR